MVDSNEFFLIGNTFLNRNVGIGISVIGIGNPFLSIALGNSQMLRAIVKILTI